ncbi:MAG: diguanylate cyclase [Gammaproteobacteria bacterium]|nr:diguanylate cyclase [Gammaproteobacteria bacterium]
MDKQQPEQFSTEDQAITCIRNPVVLLVDDQRMVAEAIRRMLADEQDIAFHYCSDPSQAMEMADQIKPTVILQDLVMPDIDGLTLVRFYRANTITEMVPVIVLSSREDPRDKSLAFSAGASDYLVKLPDQIELIARIRAHTKSYLAQMERDEAYRQLRDLQRRLEDSNAELQRLSSLDGLTGIANRRRFDEFLDTEWKRAMRTKTSLALILVDIDYFKPYNDNYGHQAGDECLRLVVECLNKFFRRSTDLFARYGGEEFVIVLPENDLRSAFQLAKKLNQAVNELNMPHGYSKVSDHVTISLGVACCEPAIDCDTTTSLIEKADQALYDAKESGRNQAKAAKPCLTQYGLSEADLD